MKDFTPLTNALEAMTGVLFPGANLRIYDRGIPVLSQTFGYADEEIERPTAPDEIYAGYSVTKLLTCACALKAAEQGRIRLTDPLSEYLPEFAHMQVLHAEPSGRYTAPAGSPIRLEHLLSMSAGFGDGPAYPADTRESVKKLSERPLLFEPGTRWAYGLCHDVLGTVLETVYQKKLRHIFRDLFFEPLGMKNSRFLSEVKDVSVLTPQYEADKNGYRRRPLDRTYAPHPDYDSGGAGLVTTADDYAVFLDALACGRILKPETLALMTADRLTGQMRRDFCWPQCRGYGYGLGVRSGEKDWGWGGAAGAYTLVDKASKASLCFFTQVLNADEVKLYGEIRDRYFECR